MLAGMRRGSTAAAAKVTGTYFPGCILGLSIHAESRLQELGARHVSGCYRNTDGKLSPATLPTPP